VVPGTTTGTRGKLFISLGTRRDYLCPSLTITWLAALVIAKFFKKVSSGNVDTVQIPRFSASFFGTRKIEESEGGLLLSKQLVIAVFKFFTRASHNFQMFKGFWSESISHFRDIGFFLGPLEKLPISCRTIQNTRALVQTFLGSRKIQGSQFLSNSTVLGTLAEKRNLLSSPSRLF